MLTKNILKNTGNQNFFKHFFILWKSVATVNCLPEVFKCKNTFGVKPPKRHDCLTLIVQLNSLQV